MGAGRGGTKSDGLKPVSTNPTTPKSGFRVGMKVWDFVIIGV